MKKIIVTIIVLFVASVLQCQIINIPDANFKFRLVNDTCVDINGDGMGDIDVDTNDDGEIQVSEAEVVIDLILQGWGNMPIYSLEGIQSFQNIERLSFNNNSVTDIDITQNNNLLWLDCRHNLLTSLNVSQNPNLMILSCSFNEISSLDISQNHNLTSLSCSFNQFTHLNVSQNHLLIALSCIDSQISDLDVSQNPNLELLRCYDSELLTNLNIKNGHNSILTTMLSYNSPNLTCIQVDDENVTYPICDLPLNGWCKDETAQYSENCSPIGVVENQNRNHINIYPNPITNKLYINNTNNVEIQSVQLFDVFGKLMLRELINFKEVDVSLLKTGVYFVKIETDSGVITKKVLKS